MVNANETANAIKPFKIKGLCQIVRGVSGVSIEMLSMGELKKSGLKKCSWGEYTFTMFLVRTR